MNEESAYDGDDIDGADEEGFVITNLDSVNDLDDAFRPDEIYLARGPFKVHSPPRRSGRGVIVSNRWVAI